MSARFTAEAPTLEDYWRSIILFGRNVASYKFALAKSLLELRPPSGRLLKLEDLALPFATHVVQHLKLADKQGTSSSSKFLDACRHFTAGEITQEQLIDKTVQHGFNNVIDAFHVVGQDSIPTRFYIDERRGNQGIRITDDFSGLLGRAQAANLPGEVESRWRLVETAWELGISRSAIAVNYDSNTGDLFTFDQSHRRRVVTGSRLALSGYQKGKCFYCFDDIHSTNEATTPDVDHFFPHRLKQHGFGAMIDGVWNLVLACQRCNRGVGGKSDKLPTLRLLERLAHRNEFLIESHHPLRETLILQTGPTEVSRRSFLNDMHNRAWALLIHTWEANEVAEPLF